MRATTAYKIAAYILIAIAVGVFCVTLYRAFYVSPQSGGAAPAYVPLTVSTSTIPVRLEIPSLSIDANVQKVGLTKSGAIGIPSNFTDVAWYEGGPVPGGAGNAIIDGHVDNAVSLPGVFKHLSSIKPGDLIEVTDAGGATLTFQVTREESVPYDATSTDVFTPTATPGLVLITCGGTWEQPIKEYSERLVIFSALLPQGISSPSS